MQHAIYYKNHNPKNANSFYLLLSILILKSRYLNNKRTIMHG